jgi:hypothetical protein
MIIPSLFKIKYILQGIRDYEMEQQVQREFCVSGVSSL